MQTEIKQNRSALHFEALPSFAAWLLEHHLEAFCRYQISLYQKLEIPLLKSFAGYSDAQLLQISIATNTEFLTYLAQNNARGQINEGIRKWKANILPHIDKNAIVAEDITYVIYVRKQAFLHFMPGYITDVPGMLQLIGEIDLFLMESETVSTNTHVNILKEELTENLHLLQKINNTLPGAVYVFDIQKYKGVYSNQNLASVIGHTQEELNVLGTNALPQLIHPEDAEETVRNLAQVRTAADGEIKTYKYRVRDKQGVYHWIRSYESPFKRAEDGTVTQTIGITLNIDTEEQLAETLREREAQYKKAEALANLGHFNYDIATQKIEWTDQLYHIYELEPQSEAMTLERFLSFVHPDDKEKVLQIKETLFTAQKTNYSFRIITAKGKEKTIRSITELQLDKEGRPVKIIGAEQDITERQNLIEQLKHSESLYKQAQALTHVGNWSWNIDTGEVQWSDELYRIYELPIGQKQTYDTILAYAHPEDRDAIADLLKESIENKSTYDKHHRLVMPDGRIKTIHRRAEVVADRDGRVFKMVGTTQDVTERQALISRLEQSEVLYKQAQEIAQVGNWIFDVATTNITWSDEVYKILGLPPQSQSLNWQLLLDMMHPNDREAAAAVLQKTIETGQPFEMYHRVRRADGARRMLHVRGEVVPNPLGKPERLIGTAQDVTQQKKIEQELRDNQMFIKKIADATPSIIASYNVHTGYYAFINEGLKKLLGYDTELVIEKGAAFFTGIIHPDDLESITQKNNRMLEEYNRPEQHDNNQAIVEFTYRMRHQNGSYRWFQTYGTIFDRNAAGHIEHVLNISLDITEQVESARIIKAQEHFIKHIADASPTILYLFDVPENRFSYINKEIFYVLGYTIEEVLQMGVDAARLIYHSDDWHLLPERQISEKRFQHTDSMMQYECRVKAKDGSWNWLLVREVIFKTGEDGNILQILGAALDITRRKDMEKTLMQNAFLLEQSNASLEEFAYVASHDLKEPLRKISTFGDRLINTQFEKLSDDGKIYLKKIVDASQRMQVMINDLLSISMISGDRAFTQYSLQAVLEEVLQTLEHKIEQKNAIIQADPLPEARVVPSQFRQLFQNLISNSLKFVREDVQPHIAIGCNYVSGEEVEHLDNARQYLKLEFRDNGIGFEEEYAGKIFAIFQRLHGRSEYEGTGIGLAICKKIVEHHGGIIYANATPGQGATFTILLPALPE